MNNGTRTPGVRRPGQRPPARTPKERQDFANDLDDPRSLVMVSVSSDRSKGGKDPAQWQPPAEANRCEYNTQWVVVMTRFWLLADSAEKKALSDHLARCPLVTPQHRPLLRHSHSGAQAVSQVRGYTRET